VVVTEAWPLLEPLPEITPTTKEIGRGFLTEFLYPFEFASVLLLMAMIGAAMITRERRSEEDE